MRIGFYTWGDPVMGMGHIFRCLTLAREMRRQFPGADIVFEAKDRAEGLAVLRDAGESVRPWAMEAVPGGPWDILVVDQLAVGADEMRALAGQCRLLVSLDDVGPGHWQAGLAINTLYRCTAPRPADSRTTSVHGLEYLLIDPAFARQSYEVRPTITNLWLTQGGSDTWDVVSRLVGDLAPWLERHPEVTLNVHTGPAFCHGEALERALSTLRTPWRRHARVADLPATLAGMDLAIASGGMMTFELLTVGVPCITVTAEPKELETTSQLASGGLCVNLGAYHTATGSVLAEALDGLAADRRAASERARANLDGRGAARIVGAMMQQIGVQH